MKKHQPTKQDRFKHFDVSERFEDNGVLYRKNTKRSAVKLTPSGRGQTHAPVRFPGNRWVMRRFAKAV